MKIVGNAKDESPHYQSCRVSVSAATLEGALNTYSVSTLGARVLDDKSRRDG